jgi:hypothetical protein
MFSSPGMIVSLWTYGLGGGGNSGHTIRSSRLIGCHVVNGNWSLRLTLLTILDNEGKNLQFRLSSKFYRPLQTVTAEFLIPC